MISGGIKVNGFAEICFILEVKFGDDNLHTMKEALVIVHVCSNLL